MPACQKLLKLRIINNISSIELPNPVCAFKIRTKELTVTTPAGSKVVTVLPQQAINNMLAAHVMTDVISEKADNELASIPNLVKLEVENGVLGYKVKGTKTHKLLGFIPIKTSVTAFVSAENGQVVTSTDSLLGRILNRIAP